MSEIKKYKARLEKRHQKIEGFGEQHGLREWARIAGIPHVSLRRYLLNGLTVEEVFKLRGIKYPPKSE